jgi:hypothetical protein
LWTHSLLNFGKVDIHDYMTELDTNGLRIRANQAAIGKHAVITHKICP